MLNKLSPPAGRTLITALLAGGVLTSMSACGGAPSQALSTPETAAANPAGASQPMSQLVSCAMAQLTPQTTANDPVLAQATNFYQQVDSAQLVPPAVQSVYGGVDTSLNQDQRNQILMMLSGLNQCPGVSSGLQQSVLSTFDQLAPQAVTQPSAPATTGSQAQASSSGTSQATAAEQIQSDNSDSDDSYADGEWNGHPWWYRPIWTHTSSQPAQWAQWGTDRSDGIWWGWDGSSWQRFGTDRPAAARPTEHGKASQPWIPGQQGVPGVPVDPAVKPIPGGVPNPAPGSLPTNPNGLSNPPNGNGSMTGNGSTGNGSIGNGSTGNGSNNPATHGNPSTGGTGQMPQSPTNSSGGDKNPGTNDQAPRPVSTHSAAPTGGVAKSSSRPTTTPDKNNTEGNTIHQNSSNDQDQAPQSGHDNPAPTN
jgi:hypothetical protein